MIDWVYKPGGPLDIMPRTKENRIYIFTRKKCKKAILLYCFQTVFFSPNSFYKVYLTALENS